MGHLASGLSGPSVRTAIRHPISNKETGEIDHDVADYWKEHYDLRSVLEKNWTTLGPKLQGKIHIYVGSADTYFLNDAVYLMQDFLEDTNNPYTTAKSNSATAPSTAGMEIRSCQLHLTAALQHHVPAKNYGAHREDRAAGADLKSWRC